MNPKVYRQYPTDRPTTVATHTKKRRSIMRVVRMKPAKASRAMKAAITAGLPIMLQEITEPLTDSDILPLMEGKNEFR